MSDAIRMAGPPRRIYLLDPIDSGAQSIKLTSKQNFHQFCENDVLPCRIRKRSGDEVNVKLRLPADTAPGTYAAQLDVDSRQYQVTVDVQPQAKLKVYPKRLAFTAKSGGLIEADLALGNVGNINIAIPENAIANLYCLQEIPAAIASTLQLASDNADELAKNLLQEIKQGYGGVMKCHLQGELQNLPPGKRAVFHFKGRVPKQAKSGGIYTGIMHIDRFHFVFEVTVL